MLAAAERLSYYLPRTYMFYYFLGEVSYIVYLLLTLFCDPLQTPSQPISTTKATFCIYRPLEQGTQEDEEREAVVMHGNVNEASHSFP